MIPLLQLMQMRPEEVLIGSTGVIGHRIKKVKEYMLLCLACDAGDKNLYESFVYSNCPSFFYFF